MSIVAHQASRAIDYCHASPTRDFLSTEANESFNYLSSRLEHRCRLNDCAWFHKMLEMHLPMYLANPECQTDSKTVHKGTVDDEGLSTRRRSLKE